LFSGLLVCHEIYFLGYYFVMKFVYILLYFFILSGLFGIDWTYTIFWVMAAFVSLNFVLLYFLCDLAG